MVVLPAMFATFAPEGYGRGKRGFRGGRRGRQMKGDCVEGTYENITDVGYDCTYFSREILRVWEN